MSTRSPVFKQRPLPRSKKEAIDLMMEQPNLIRRPILIAGSKVIFGFDKEAYDEAGMSDVRDRHVGLELSLRQGHVERHLLSGRPTGRTRRAASSTSCAFYAEHFDTVEINSTFYGVPPPQTAQRLGRAHAAGLRVLAEALSEVHAPGDVPQGDRARIRWTSASKDVDEFRAAIDPLASAGKLGALLAQFPASFKNEPDSRGYLEWLLRAFRDYPVAVELRHRSWSDDPAETLQLLDAFGAAWAQIDEPKFRFSIRQNLLPNVQTFYYLRLHGRNAAQWWRHEKSEDRYNYLYSAEELEPFAEAAEAASREVKKAYLYANNHFSAKSVANAAMLKHKLGQPLAGEYPEEFVERYPDLKGLVKVLPAAHSFTEAFLSTSAALDLRRRRPCPLMTWPKTVYLPSSSGCGSQRDVELAVGGRRSMPA